MWLHETLLILSEPSGIDWCGSRDDLPFAFGNRLVYAMRFKWKNGIDGALQKSEVKEERVADCY